MPKKFYASGFLYHPDSTKILLQQENSHDPKSLWSMLGSKNVGSETSQENFVRNAKSFLHLDLLANAVFCVYDYLHLGKNYVSYTEVKKLTDFPQIGKTIFAWFKIKEITKLSLSDQTRQDLTVGQRVIDSGVRKKAGGQTLE